MPRFAVWASRWNYFMGSELHVSEARDGPDHCRLRLSKEGKPMKPLMPAALLMALSTGALAKPTPIELPTALVDAGVMNVRSGGPVQENAGSIGAMREREYFEATQSPINAFPCRIEPVLFSKVRLAQSCR
jgi:hypothetical protein